MDRHFLPRFTRCLSSSGPSSGPSRPLNVPVLSLFLKVPVLSLMCLSFLWGAVRRYAARRHARGTRHSECERPRGHGPGRREALWRSRRRRWHRPRGPTRHVPRRPRPQRRGKDDNGRDSRGSDPTRTAASVDRAGSAPGAATIARLRSRSAWAFSSRRRELEREARRCFETDADVPQLLPRRPHGSRRRSLATIGLEDKARTPASRRSPAGRSSVCRIGCALLNRPEILFLDEPTTGLDPQARRTAVGRRSRPSRPSGGTVVLTTHYMEEAERLADDLDHRRPRPSDRRGSPVSEHHRLARGRAASSSFSLLDADARQLSPEELTRGFRGRAVRHVARRARFSLSVMHTQVHHRPALFADCSSDGVWCWRTCATHRPDAGGRLRHLSPESTCATDDEDESSDALDEIRPADQGAQVLLVPARAGGDLLGLRLPDRPRRGCWASRSDRAASSRASFGRRSCEGEGARAALLEALRAWTSPSECEVYDE